LDSFTFFSVFSRGRIFWISLKREIDALKQDIKEQIINLRSEIQNSVSVLTQVSSEFHKVEDIDISQISVPDDVSFLFSVRYTIERELKRVLQNILTK